MLRLGIAASSVYSPFLRHTGSFRRPRMSEKWTIYTTAVGYYRADRPTVANASINHTWSQYANHQRLLN